MRVRMRTTVAGPDFACQAGKIIDLPCEQAQAFIDGRYAEKVGPDAEEVAVEEGIETTDAGQPETSGRRGNKRR